MFMTNADIFLSTNKQTFISFTVARTAALQLEVHRKRKPNATPVKSEYSFVVAFLLVQLFVYLFWPLTGEIKISEKFNYRCSKICRLNSWPQNKSMTEHLVSFLVCMNVLTFLFFFLSISRSRSEYLNYNSNRSSKILINWGVRECETKGTFTLIQIFDEKSWSLLVFFIFILPN